MTKKKKKSSIIRPLIGHLLIIIGVIVTIIYSYEMVIAPTIIGGFLKVKFQIGSGLALVILGLILRTKKKKR